MKNIIYAVKNNRNTYNYGTFEYKNDAEQRARELNKDAKQNEGIKPFYVEEIEAKVEDVDLMKGNYNTGDTLTWTYKGKEYSCTGEFYVDKDNNLHHTFIAPTGEEIEIVTPYE